MTETKGRTTMDLLQASCCGNCRYFDDSGNIIHCDKHQIDTTSVLVCPDFILRVSVPYSRDIVLRGGYTPDEQDELHELVDELPALLYGRDDFAYEDTIGGLHRLVDAATKRRAKAKADELLSLNQWSVDLRKINS